jgi:NADH-quinone oxidoreductase subunit C
MSKQVIERLQAVFGERILEATNFRGDEEVRVAPKDWKEVATFLRDDAQLAMNHFIDLTAVDWPEREPEAPRFDVLLFVRSMTTKHRIRLLTRVREGEELDSLLDVWAGANWTEREVFDMFGVSFRSHPDLRRILMYPEFVGYPLRKDYPIERVQPLVEYREVEGIDKLAPFGAEEGQPWNRVDWTERLHGRDIQVSTAIAESQGPRRAISAPEE